MEAFCFSSGSVLSAAKHAFISQIYVFNRAHLNVVTQTCLNPLNYCDLLLVCLVWHVQMNTIHDAHTHSQTAGLPDRFCVTCDVSASAIIAVRVKYQGEHECKWTIHAAHCLGRKRLFGKRLPPEFLVPLVRI